MAAYTITTAQNITALTAKTGGDTYTINGGTLTVDADSRYGLNQTTSASLAAITVSATLGGVVDIDARFVRLIAFTGGSGTAPAADTTISQGGASGKLICVYSALNATPIAAAAAMPAAGFVKVRQWNATPYAAGALTGITATSSGADVAGFIELVGDDAATATVPRLGTFRVRGEWFDVGATNGTANQQIQLPTNGLLQYYAGVFIEKTVGAGDYEFYPNAASQTAVAADIRAKVCYISTAGLLRIGHNGTANAAYTPVTGLKIRIGNILFRSCTTAARTANVLPNATLATRYDFATGGGGAIEIDKADCGWYLSFAQAFSVALSNVGTLEQISVSEIASPMAWQRVGVGQTAAQSQVALQMSLCFAGGTFTDCHFSRATLATSGFYTATIADCSNFNFNNCMFTALTPKANATSGNFLLTRASNVVFTSPVFINGRAALSTCSAVRFTNSIYVDRITGTTTSTAAEQSYAFDISNGCVGTVIDGLSFLELTNLQPYLGILNIAAAGCANTKLRNIGTRAAPLNLGSTNNGAYLIVWAGGAAATATTVQRCYVSNTRTGLYTIDNSSTGVIFESVAGDYADAPVSPMLNGQHKNVGCTHPLTVQTACYGTHWVDMFTAATTGRVAILMNEKTSAEPSASAYAVLSGSPQFTSAGGLYMPLVGQSIEFTMHYLALGHTSFANLAPVMAGGTIGNYTLQYQIDKNNGAGFSALQTLNAANLFAEAGINAALGIKLKIRITTAIANATAITSLYINTVSTAIAQNNLYPLDTNNLTLTGLQSGSDVVIRQAGTTTILSQLDAIAGTSSAFVYSGAQVVDVAVFKNGLVPYFINALSLGVTDSAVPVSQITDRNWI